MMVIGQVKVKSHEFSELGIGGRETCLTLGDAGLGLESELRLNKTAS